VLLFALIALLVLMIGAVALVRSFNTTLFNNGNLAFKKDLQNQSERVATRVFAQLSDTGNLATPGIRANNHPEWNYSAQMLPTNAKGIPLALLTEGGLTGTGVGTNDIVSEDGSVTIRYVVDRLCRVTGDETTLGASACILASGPEKGDGSADDPRGGSKGGVTAAQQVIYRVSVRATGPRQTQAYFQSTFAL
jgi:hypothetical protein